MSSNSYDRGMNMKSSKFIVLLYCLLLLLSSVAEATEKQVSSLYLHPIVVELDSKYGEISNQTLTTINKSIVTINRIFSLRNSLPIRISFTSPKQFSKIGAPDWSSGIYDKGTIYLPSSLIFNRKKLFQTIGHEYTHAVINYLSKGNCPPWLDEGLAEILSGGRHNEKTKKLRSWISKHQMLPLDSLEGGFMHFQQNEIPVAYGQSLFASKSLLNRFGLSQIRTFLTNLATNNTSRAFKLAFGIDIAYFESDLSNQLVRWAKTDNLLL